MQRRTNNETDYPDLYGQEVTSSANLRLVNDEIASTNEKTKIINEQDERIKRLISNITSIKETLIALLVNNQDSEINYSLDFFSKGELRFNEDLDFNPYSLLPLNKRQQAPSSNQCFATQNFTNVLKKLNECAQSFEKITKEAIDLRVISKSEVDTIIQSANDHTVQLYPAFQSLFEKEKATLVKPAQEIFDKRQSQLDVLQSKYKARTEDYRLCHAVTLMIAPLILPIPVLLGGLICHAIDKLITTLREKKLQSEMNDISNALNSDIDQVKQKYLNPSNPLDCFKQRFFETCKIQRDKIDISVGLDKEPEPLYPKNFRS